MFKDNKMTDTALLGFIGKQAFENNSGERRKSGGQAGEKTEQI